MASKAWREIASQATRPRANVDMCLRGDLLARRADNLSADEREQLQKEIEEASVTFVIEGLTRQDFRALEAEHPGKDGEGWNLDTFPEALVRACLLEPEIEPNDPFFEVLTSGQIESLFEAAFKVCVESDASYPFF